MKKQLLALLTVVALACGGEDGSTGPNPSPTDNNPTISLQVPAGEVVSRPVSIAYQAADDNGLTTIVVELGDGLDTTITASSRVRSGTITHAYQNAGTYTVRGTVTDTKSQTGTATGSIFVSVPDSATISFIYTHYFSGASNSTGIQAWLEADGSQYPVSFQNGTGTILIEQDKEYRYFHTDADNPDLARLNIGDAIAFGYRVLSATQNAGKGIPLTFTTDKTISVQSIESDQFLNDLAQTNGGILVVPQPGAIFVVPYDGPCAQDWNPGDACNKGGAPYGGQITQQGFQNANNYRNQLSAIFDDSRIGFNAYNFIYDIIDSGNWQARIAQFTGTDDLSAIIPQDNVILIRKQRNPIYQEGLLEGLENGVSFQQSARMSVYLGVATGFVMGQENPLFRGPWEAGDANPFPNPHPICSIRDEESNYINGISTVPGCSLDLNTDLFSVKDPDLMIMAEAFGVVYQQQPESDGLLEFYEF